MRQLSIISHDNAANSGASGPSSGSPHSIEDRHFNHPSSMSGDPESGSGLSNSPASNTRQQFNKFNAMSLDDNTFMPGTPKSDADIGAVAEEPDYAGRGGGPGRRASRVAEVTNQFEAKIHAADGSGNVADNLHHHHQHSGQKLSVAADSPLAHSSDSKNTDSLSYRF
jgi:hypothetical protein